MLDATEQALPAKRPASAALRNRLWHSLTRPWLLAVTAIPALLMLAAAWLFPQMPGQLQNEPAAAARWLSTQSASYGALGDALAAIGAFDVLGSPLLRVLLASVGFLLFVHLADQVASALLVRQLRHRLLGPLTPASPLPVSSPHPIYRLRYARPESAEKVADDLAGRLARDFDSVERAVAAADGAPSVDAVGGSDRSSRMLALRAPWAVYLRALSVVGMLLALLGTWQVAFFGWRLSLAELAPGASYQYDPQDVELNYAMDVGDTDTMTAKLVARIGKDEAQSAVPGDQRMRVGRVDVRAAADAPALLIATTDGRAALVRPGQSRAGAQVGLVFPTAGSEETLLLPNDALGLRVVRGAEGAAPYQVEVYASDDVRPAQRISLQADGVQTLKAGNAVVDLEFTMLPSLAVTVSYVPAPWLLWLALVLAVTGAVGFVRTPAFLVAQVEPWPADRAVVVLQSQRSADLQQVQIGP